MLQPSTFFNPSCLAFKRTAQSEQPIMSAISLDGFVGKSRRSISTASSVHILEVPALLIAISPNAFNDCEDKHQYHSRPYCGHYHRLTYSHRSTCIFVLVHLPKKNPECNEGDHAVYIKNDVIHKRQNGRSSVFSSCFGCGTTTDGSPFVGASFAAGAGFSALV